MFPDIVVKGCLFYFTQNIHRKIQANGQQVQYQQEPGFVTQVRMIAAVAFIPGNDIDRVFNILSYDNDLL